MILPDFLRTQTIICFQVCLFCFVKLEHTFSLKLCRLTRPLIITFLLNIWNIALAGVKAKSLHSKSFVSGSLSILVRWICTLTIPNTNETAAQCPYWFPVTIRMLKLRELSSQKIKSHLQLVKTINYRFGLFMWRLCWLSRLRLLVRRIVQTGILAEIQQRRVSFSWCTVIHWPGVFSHIAD